MKLWKPMADTWGSQRHVPQLSDLATPRKPRLLPGLTYRSRPRRPVLWTLLLTFLPAPAPHSPGPATNHLGQLVTFCGWPEYSPAPSAGLPAPLSLALAPDREAAPRTQRPLSRPTQTCVHFSPRR